MPEIEELRRVLRARESLAPDPAGITAAAVAQGVRLRRTRLAGTLAAGAFAVVVVVALGAAVVGGPQAGRLPGGDRAVVATPTDPVGGGWPAVPSYSGPAVPGAAVVPGPTGGPGAPVSGRSIDPVVPYRVTLPEGWREVEWWYEEGSFRGTWTGPDDGVDLAVITVLDPATRPASVLEPSGDPATGTPGQDGTLAWLVDPRHFVRVQLQNDPPDDVLSSIARTLRVTERPMIAPFRLDHLPAGLHLSGARISLGIPQTDPGGSRPWEVTLWFDHGTGPTGTTHDLEINLMDDLDPSSTPPIRNPTTVGGHPASVQRLQEQDVTLVQVFGIGGRNPSFIIGNPAADRITVEEVGRVADGMHVVPDADDTGTWIPVRLP